MTAVRRTDVVVIGGGLMGAMTALEVARRGRAVTLLEAREPGHALGSSHGSARIFRRAYPDPWYVALTGRAGGLWRRLEDDAGERLLRPTGGLDHGRRRDPERLAAVLAAAGVPAALLAPAAAAERWPGMGFDTRVLFHEDAGVLDPERAIAAALRLAEARGGEIHHGTPALALEPAGDRVYAHTAGFTVEAARVVVAAGPWLPPLLADLPVKLPPLTVTQQQAFHFAPAAPVTADWPVFVHKDTVSLYGLPAGRDGGAPGVIKIGEHGEGAVTTADTRDGRVDPASRERVAEFVRARLPVLDPAPIAQTSCLYTSTRSDDFVVDRRGPVVVCSACSGHGAKFAPLIGELAAALACDDAVAAEPRFALPN